MTLVSIFSAVAAPNINWGAISPAIALMAGACAVLILGLFIKRSLRVWTTSVTCLLALGTTIGLSIWRWNDNTSVIQKALVIDDLTLVLTIIFSVAGIGAVLLSLRSIAAKQAGHGEYYALILSSILGMFVLASTNDLVSLFVGFELLSIPLYVLCATEIRRSSSLESGLKYLIIGSVGSATLLYGLALIFGATGHTEFNAIASASTDLTDDVLFLTGIALAVVGLAFKASVAPFHQWTPDVYEGAPTAVTGFMAVATKAAAFGVFLRLFDVALIEAASDWAPVLAVLATVTIIVGNVGALGQSSLKRLMGYSGVAQAGYMLAGVVVATRLGVQATVFYLAVYTIMNLGIFAVIIIRERETELGDDITAFYGLGSRRPGLAWPMTICLLALAGIPATAGFFGKIYLIDAAVNNGYAWLGVMIVIGSALSLAYYLRVVSALWMRAPLIRDDVRPAEVQMNSPENPGHNPQNGQPKAKDQELSSKSESVSRRRTAPSFQPKVVFVALLCAGATLFFGIFPQPLFSVARDAGEALINLF